MIGQVIGQYRLIRELGRGGMATVYLAQHAALDRQVAIKLLDRALFQDQSFTERFTREARLLAQLEHPGILPIYDFGVQDGNSYIVMRYLSGGSLSDLLTRNRVLSLSRASNIVQTVAGALDYAHSRAIIHRDIKPGNVLFDDAQNPFLADFGIAKVLQRNSTLTGDGLIGTPAYMSPELGSGSPIDHRSDIYQLGLVLYEMLTGEVPFQADTPMSVILKHMADPVPQLETDQLSQLGLPVGINPIFLRVLAKKPSDRYATASELGKALAALDAGTEPPAAGVMARPLQPPAPTMYSTNPAMARPVPAAPPRPSVWDRFGTWISRWTAPVKQPDKPQPPPAPHEDLLLVPLAERAPSTTPKLQPSGTMIIRRGLEAVVSRHNQAIIDDWLDLYAAKQLGQKLMQSGDRPHLLLTGFGSFGGTSLVRGITKRLRAQTAPGSDWLAVRLETGRQNRQTLYINENRVDVLTAETDARRLALGIDAAMRGQDPSQITQHGRAAPTTSGQALAGLVVEAARTFAGPVNDAALRQALQQAARVLMMRRIFFFDRLDDSSQFLRLRESCLVNDPAVTLVVIARRESYDHWPQEVLGQLSEAGFDEWYVRRLWDRDMDLSRELRQLMVQILPTDDDSQQALMEMLFDHLAFKARGSLAVALRELKDERSWLRDNQQQQLDVMGKYLSNREEIEHNAFVHRLLKEHHDEILRSLFNDAPSADQALIGVHYLMDWMRKHPIFSRADLDMAATVQTIVISDQVLLQRAVTTNLLTVLTNTGYLAWQAADGVYEISWRHPVEIVRLPTATTTLSTAPAAASAPAPTPLKPLPVGRASAPRVGLIGSRDDNLPRTRAITAQLAFEIVDGDCHLVTIDRMGASMPMLAKLERYWEGLGSLDAGRVATLISVNSYKASPHVEVLAVPNASAQLERLLDSVDVLVVAGCDTASDSIYSLDNISTQAARQGLQVLPVGPVGGSIEAMWQQLMANLSDQYDGRVTATQFLAIGPQQTDIPDVARGVVALIRQLFTIT